MTEAEGPGNVQRDGYVEFIRVRCNHRQTLGILLVLPKCSFTFRQKTLRWWTFIKSK
jgi:hypothetical protein